MPELPLITPHAPWVISGYSGRWWETAGVVCQHQTHGDFQPSAKCTIVEELLNTAGGLALAPGRSVAIPDINKRCAHAVDALSKPLDRSAPPCPYFQGRLLRRCGANSQHAQKARTRRRCHRGFQHRVTSEVPLCDARRLPQQSQSSSSSCATVRLSFCSSRRRSLDCCTVIAHTEEHAASRKDAKPHACKHMPVHYPSGWQNICPATYPCPFNFFAPPS